MNVLICYEMAHDKGHSVGDCLVEISALTRSELQRARGEIVAAAEANVRKDGLVPTGGLVFRSVTRLDG